MSDHERGAYTPPTDAPLSFDARQPVRGASPPPVTLIVGIIVLAGLAVAIFMFYRSGVRQAGQAPQTVGAPIGDLTAPPPSEAQPQDPAAGLQIYKGEGDAPASAGGAPIFTSPPELPQPRTAAPTVVVTPPPLPAAAAPTPALALRPSITTSAPLPEAAKAPPPAPKAMPVPPKPAPVVKAAAPPPPKAAPANPEPVKAAAPKPAATSAGGAVVQIGAVSSTALADKAWADAVAVAPGLAAGKGKGVEKIEKNGGTLYRTAVTGFASREAATAFCDKLKAAGKSCFVR